MINLKELFILLLAILKILLVILVQFFLPLTLREKWFVVMEIFLLPGEKPAGGYFHFSINPNGSLYDSWKKNAKWNCEGLKLASKRNTDSWTVELSIPLNKLPLPENKDLFSKAWRLNINRMRPKRDLEPAVETAWSPTLGPNSHVPARFGYIFLECN